MLKIVLFLSLILTVQVSSQEIYLPLNQENTITPTPIIDIEVLEEFDDPVMPEYVESIAWSPDGSKIAAGIGPETCIQSNNDYSVRILDPQTHQTVDKLEHYHNCAVADVDWNSDGTHLISSGFI